MGLAQEKKLFTPEEYLALERAAEYKSELVNGEIIAMAGTSRSHLILLQQILFQIQLQLKSKPCHVYFSEMRVAVNKTGLYTYPDLSITCGKEEFLDSSFDTLLNPICIIEVLSDSTEKYDRGDKFLHYQKIDSLKEYILVSQKKLLIEKFQRSGTDWIYTVYSEPDSIMPIESSGIKISLAEIYEGLEIESKL